MTGNSELSLALLDVRRAYRLLWSYQRRMLDMMCVIADAFEEHEFYVWEPSYFEPPCKRTRDPSKHWAWDMLPMVNMAYLCLPEGADRNHPKKGQWMLEILLTSDSGFELSETENEPDSKTFAPAENAESTLTLLAWQCTADTDLNWHAKMWAAHDYPEGDDVLTDLDEMPFRVLSKTFELSTLADRNAVRAAVAQFQALVDEKMGIQTFSE
ncbi:hypothetical protein QM467_15785 [Rhodoblastus sp. 17X3]|uniref:hypothetical protein n=1 Tax=Rhodoblastus sp. 17X3 TaxID=3047026 RepID=UPI0024B82034|nr:hypothetical protein [Rhodoblastus sp. 17X3]MDI9849517.1 hypothetical protein [Rhodoblastus sp. 17X3]